jgi:hypothetical protein
MGRSPIQQATEIKTEPKQLSRPKIMPLLADGKSVRHRAFKHSALNDIAWTTNIQHFFTCKTP